MRSVILLSALLALPGPLAAQAGQLRTPEPRAGSAVGLVVTGSRVAGEGRILVGGWGGIVLGNRFLVGGGGMALTQDVDLPRYTSSTGFQLGFGYAGLFLKYWKDLSFGLVGEGGLLMGAGHAEVHDQIIGQEAGSDNFLILEPQAAVSRRLFGQLHGGAGLGYRLPLGVEDLPRVRSEDLRCLTLSIFLRLGGR